MSELGSTQATASHNPGLSASENPRRSRGNPRAKEIKTAACRLMKCLGLVPTFRNLYIVQLAIETEMDISSTSIAAATDQIIADAIAARQVGEHVDYFWFEDGCWRHPKLTFKQRDEMQMRSSASIGIWQ